MSRFTKLKSKLGNILNKRFILVTSIMLLGNLALTITSIFNYKTNRINEISIENAKLYSQALVEFRTLYTSEVVTKLKKSGFKLTHDYKNNPKTFPLPATLAIMLGEKIGAHRDGAKMKLYSGYPFPWRENMLHKDQFAKKAWEALNQDSSKPFYQFTNNKGKYSIRYAVADTMRKSCISCHNTHLSSPKKNWKEGDVRGILEVTHPLNHIMTKADSDLEKLIFLMIIAHIIIFIITIMGFLRFKKSIQAQKNAEKTMQLYQDKLELEIKKRTEELEKSYQNLEQKISENKKMSLQLNQANKMESIGQLAAGIAHEINNPIQFVLGNIKFLQDAFSDFKTFLGKNQVALKNLQSGGEIDEIIKSIEEAKIELDMDYLFDETPKSINDIINGSDRVAKIVVAMKEFSHPGGLEMAPLDINEAIKSTVTISKNEWKYSAELSTDLNSNIPIVQCYGGLINQVLLNCIINSSHAIASHNEEGVKGIIEIGTQRKQESIIITIKDNGGGIDEKIKEKVFDPFFTTKEVGIGTGQGLYISYSNIVEKHHGEFYFENNDIGGVTFFIKIPIEQKSYSHEPAEK